MSRTIKKIKARRGTKKGGAAGRNIDRYCELPELDVSGESGDNISSSKYRALYKHYLCDDSVLDAEEKKQSPLVQETTRITKFNETLCRPAATAYDKTKFRNTPSKYLVSHLTDAERCLTGSSFLEPNNRFLKDKDGIALLDKPFIRTFDTQIIPGLFGIGGQPPYIKSGGGPKYIEINRSPVPITAARQGAFVAEVLATYFERGNNLHIPTLLWPDGLVFPNDLAGMEHLISEERYGIQSQSWRSKTIMPVVFEGKTYILKRYNRLVKLPKSEIHWKGCSLDIDASEIPSMEFDSPTFNKLYEKVAFLLGDFEYREIISNLFLTFYCNTLYGSGLRGGYVCPTHYAIIFVPSYEITTGPLAGNTVTSEIFIVSEPMTNTFMGWIRESEKTEAEMRFYLESADYLYKCLHYNEILPAFVKKYLPFFVYGMGGRAADGVSPVFINSSDCKDDNIMINAGGQWKLIDMDGMKFASDIFDSLGVTRQYEESPITCVADPGALKAKAPVVTDYKYKKPVPPFFTTNIKLLKYIIDNGTISLPPRRIFAIKQLFAAMAGEQYEDPTRPKMCKSCHEWPAGPGQEGYCSVCFRKAKANAAKKGGKRKTRRRNAFN